jgi:hypothetical protein
MSKEEIAEKMATYDRIFKEASEFDHLCQGSNGSCARGTPTCCIVQPGSLREACDNLDPINGCRINTLMCKIWFCGFMKGKHPELVPKIEEWAKQAATLPKIIYFQSRNDYERSLERI